MHEEKFDENSNLLDEESLEQLEHVLRELVEHHHSLASV